MRVTVHYAKTHLSKLLEAVERGDDVTIARGSVPVARLVPVASEPVVFGLLKGVIPPPPDDLFDPMDEDELALWEGRLPSHGTLP